MSKIVLTIELNEGDTLERAIKSLQWGPPIMFAGKGGPNSLKPGAAYPIADSEPEMTDEQAAAYSKTEAEIKSYGQMPAAAPGVEILKTTAEMVRANLAANAQPLGPMDGERKRGEPAPGHRRRTNAQIAEDNAYLAQSASLDGAGATVLQPNMTEAIEITGPEVSSEDAAQDAADEAAETAQRKSDKPTLEDLRAAVGRYTAKVGAAASIGSIRDIVGCAMVDVAEADIPAAIARVKAATNGSIVVGVAAYDEKKALAEKGISVTGEPIGPDDSPLRGDPKIETATAGTAAPAELEPSKPGTKVDVKNALMAYLKKYDGDVDPNLAIYTQQDGKKILTRLFGPSVDVLSMIPQTSEAYGRARDAIDAATRDNPFGRAVKS